jgi:hypothetical protein
VLRWDRLDSDETCDVDSHYGRNQGRGRRKKRTKFEMRDECRAPKHTFSPLGTKKGMADREVGGKWVKAKSDGVGK